MHRNFLRSVSALLALIAIINWGCSKIDTTTIGEDLIPAIDNLHTFADTLDIQTSQGAFSTDTTGIGYSENHIVGRISNDPVFGKTQADVYLDLKPTFYPFYFGSAGNVINNLNAPGAGDSGYDSAFLCLAYKGFYGDTTVPQRLTVYQLDYSASNLPDSSRLNSPQPALISTAIGSAVIDPRTLKDSIGISNNKVKVANQIRIKLSDAFLNQLKSRDSARLSGNNAFYSDADFKRFYKGFAVIAEGGVGGVSNGLFYINLFDQKTRLEVHYRRKSAGVTDTSFTSFQFYKGPTALISNCGQMNIVQRNTSGAEFNPTTLSGQPGALYIQSTPFGSYANLKIPALDHFPNCIVHRAEIFVEQIPGNPATDSILTPPTNLLLDLKDTGSVVRYKPVYFDLRPTASYDPDNAVSLYGFLAYTGIDIAYFGGSILYKRDGFGNKIAYYNFNISRYVQHIVTNHIPNYQLRLYAPYNLSYQDFVLPFANSLAYGRLKIGDGNNPNYKLKMRIVYTKL